VNVITYIGRSSIVIVLENVNPGSAAKCIAMCFCIIGNETIVTCISFNDIRARCNLVSICVGKAKAHYVIAGCTFNNTILRPDWLRA